MRVIYGILVTMAKKGRRATEEERVIAVQLIESGEKIDDVVKAVGVGRSTVLEWWRKYREGGLAALSTKFASGRPTVLTDSQMLELRALILGSDPRQFSLGFALWTRTLVGELIVQRFKVTLSEVTVGRILKKLGMSVQRPLYRAHQQNPELVRAWKQDTFPKIRQEAAECGATVLFADEAAVRTDFHAGTTWGAVGQTPVVSATGERKTVMMVSAIGARGQLRFRLHEGSFRAVHFIEFCKQLMADIPGIIFLIVDGSSVHTAKEVKEFVKTTDGRLHLYFLPPYSPELNPDEWVWKHVKHDKIGRSAVRNKNELLAVARSALASLQKMPRIVRGFFADPALAYLRGLML
jgi:transposase